MPTDIQDPATYRAAVRQMRPKLYQMARRYWQAAGDQARLQLSDAELDQVFWLIDAEGIPRLKSDQVSIPQPIDPLEALVGQIEEAPTDL